jgi:hypothetical protein
MEGEVGRRGSVGPRAEFWAERPVRLRLKDEKREDGEELSHAGTGGPPDERRKERQGGGV